jgi:flagellar hook-length control protein FliK
VIEQIQKGIENSVRQGQSSIRLQLSPQELGNIQIHLISNAHGISVTVTAEHQGTSQLLEAQLNQLRQSLSDAGVQLSNLNINQQQSQLSSFSQGANQQGQPQTPYSRMRNQMGGESEEVQPTLKRNIASGAGVDYRI